MLLLAMLTGEGVIAVSLDGTLINKAGLMTGGQDNRNSRQWDEQEVKSTGRARHAMVNMLSLFVHSTQIAKGAVPSATAGSAEV